MRNIIDTAEWLNTNQHPTKTAQNIILVIFHIPESPVTTEKCDDMNGNTIDDDEKEDLQCLQICESVLKGLF